MTDQQATFPEPNLNPSAYPWARQVQARIADRERAAGQHEDRLKSLSQSIVSTQRKMRPGAWVYKGEWQGQTLGGPTINIISAGAGVGVG